jgi:acetyltransferase-like isoleucine patch superfamily enzyme
MTSLVSSRARIGKNVTIGDFCKIHDNVVIGDNTTIGDYCSIGAPSPLAEGAPLEIGPNSLVRSYSCLYEGSTMGPGFTTGDRVTIRERTQIGEQVQIGTLSDVQGHCTIGNHVRTHSNVHISQLSVIHDFVWLFPYTVLTNDPHPPSDGYKKGVIIEAYAVVASSCTILPGIRIGQKSLVGAHSMVNRDVPPGKVVTGVPAKVVCDTFMIPLADGSGKPAYPWTKHFHRGYPEAIVAEWKKATEGQ